MKDDNVIILAGALLAGIAYKVGKRQGFNECLYNCQKAVLEVLVEKDKEEKEES